MTNRELDALIAENVFGCKVSREYADQYPDGIHIYELGGVEKRVYRNAAIPQYSTDLNEAFHVIEKMRETGAVTYMCTSDEFFSVEMGFTAQPETRQVFDESPARAICLCALKVIEEMEKK